MPLNKMKLLEAIALLLAADQGVIDLTSADKILIGKAINHTLKES
jgi:hypothetical protein